MRAARRTYEVGLMGASLPRPQTLFTPNGLIGTWSVTRQIKDARTLGTAHLIGQATFTPDADGLTYDEVGTLTLPGGQSFTATRRYLWRFEPILRVLFEDGRLFHTLDSMALDAPLLHHCGDDLYRGHFSAGPTQWETRWHVTGPRKDQHSHITYRRS